jgi:hypothetical protein
MATRSQIQHYRRLAEQAETERAAGVDRETAPAPVPELVPVAGGTAVVVAGTVVDVIAYADAWGNGR